MCSSLLMHCVIQLSVQPEAGNIKGGGARSAKTAIVNATFEKNECGSLVLNSTHPIFEEYEEKRRVKFTKSKQVGDSM